MKCPRSKFLLGLLSLSFFCLSACSASIVKAGAGSAGSGTGTSGSGSPLRLIGLSFRRLWLSGSCGSGSSGSGVPAHGFNGLRLIGLIQAAPGHSSSVLGHSGSSGSGPSGSFSGLWVIRVWVDRIGAGLPSEPLASAVFRH